MLVGQVPALASAFQDRPALRERVDSARSTAGTVVLTQVLSGGGGSASPSWPPVMPAAPWPRARN